MGLRDKYKAIPIDTFKKKVEEEDEALATSNGRSEFIELKDGKTTKIRFLPAHEGEENFYKKRKQHWITIEQDGDQVRRTVPNAVECGHGLDVIEEYMSFAFKTLDPNDKGELEKIECIKGDYPRKGGLKGSTSWIAYALEIDGETRKFGLLEFKKTVRDAINKEARVEDDDSPITVDPFTDPDEGLPVLIKYNSKPNKKKNENHYEVTLSKKALKLTDDELEKLDKSTPLSELYGSYTMKDFERALEGLQIFDAEHDINLFENDEWLAKVEEVKEQFTETGEKDEDTKAKAKTPAASKKAAKVDPKQGKLPLKPAKDEEDEEEEGDSEKTVTDENEEDQFDAMDRNELKVFNSNNTLGVIPKKSMTDDQLRKEVRDAWTAKNAEEEATEAEPEEAEEEAEEEATEAVDFDSMDRTELKAYISDNNLKDDIKVLKSMSDDDIRNALKKHFGMETAEAEEESDEEEVEEVAPKKKNMTADDIRAKLKGSKGK